MLYAAVVLGYLAAFALLAAVLKRGMSLGVALYPAHIDDALIAGLPVARRHTALSDFRQLVL